MRYVAIAALCVAAGSAGAQNALDGQDIFTGYCAACHGLEGRGDGPMAAVLSVLPTDLTGLAAAAGGTFPVAAVAARIDGRDPVLAHGGPMPLFGTFFEGDDVAIATETGQPMLTSRAIADLIAWLETIQE